MRFSGLPRALWLVILFVLAGMLLACDLGSFLGGGGDVPSVVIERPPSGVEVRLGEIIPINATATDSTGVTKLELWVDDALLATETSPVAEGQSPLLSLIHI